MCSDVVMCVDMVVCFHGENLSDVARIKLSGDGGKGSLKISM